MMVNDRLVLKIKTYDDDDEYRNRVIKIKEEGTIRLEIHGKDGSGTKKMAIEVRYNRLANAIRFHIE
ncbi:MAG: hypothetical protein U9R75_11295, partial [Candidatus Thermoplasmatota archaeon]|nr:hypothetical protein [Candidatus Thermoplasmatota archaeon]